ncbi:hypothetical protein M1M07_29450 [Rhodococcus sp. HM1]|uniref:hypothetical protein n=1 Tax=Rhodococcus sp. HM1 TaxID=2937759 RepID=UPI00200AF256|nr:MULTISPECIES: hypothetical protein [unclassified Rhodococcus (in: high G+C Gram-positive bacteria)]MCK8675221.1 hypothetical protein [Rhodococcus sp. HM1]
MDEDRKPDEYDDLDDDTKRSAQERAHEIQQMYEPGARPTVTVPGTRGMVSGTAFAHLVESEDGPTTGEGQSQDGTTGEQHR